MVCFSVCSALASAFSIALRPAPTTTTPILQNTIRSTRHQRPQNKIAVQAAAPFSTSTQLQKKKDKGPKTDRRITLIRYHLHHPTTLTPRPLRFSRTRHLRHWTIHRARSLYTANLKRNRELELERQYNAMAAANEELRIGAGDGGKLFRKAQMKTGTWSIPERGGGVPIEYARGMVEWIGTLSGGVGGRAKVWDGEWKRA